MIQWPAPVRASSAQSRLLSRAAWNSGVIKNGGTENQKNTASVEKFLNDIADELRRGKDCFRLVEIMKTETKAEPAMWGTSIVGFGRHQYKYSSGRELEWFLIGFSPRKQDLTLYIMRGVERYPALMKKLGKHKTRKSCLYIKKLDDVDLPTLRQLIKQSIADLAAMKK